MHKKHKKYFVAYIMAVISISTACGSALAGGFLDVAFPRADFLPAPAGQVINNPYWPLNPDGMSRTFTYIGETEDECVIDQISVNDNYYGKTHTLLGAMPYTNLVALQVVDTEWVFEEFEECDPSVLLPNDDAIAELTFDWYLQDVNENIWYVGEASRDFGDECPSLDDVPLGTSREGWPTDELFLECTGGSWEAGQPGQEEGEIIGQAGIVVPGDRPKGDKLIKPGTYYMQEVAEGAEDMAKILRVNASLTVEDDINPGEYDNCRKVKEWNPFDHGSSVEHKWYCADGDGLVLIQGIGGGPTEVEVLVDVSPSL